MKNSILKALNKLTGGKGDKKSLSDFPSKEVAMGQKVEMEHTSDPKLADEITADHLTENPHYYSKLKESGLADELEKGVKTFHGTVQNFDKFKLPKKSGPVLNYGTGIYSATSPEEAAEYAEPQPHYRDADAAAFSEMRSNKKIKAHLDSQAKKYGLKGSDDYKHKNYDKYRNEFEKPYVHNHISEKLKYTPHVKRLDVDIKNAFDPHNLDHAKKIAALAGHAKSFDGMEDLANDKDNPTNFWDMLTDGETLGWNERTRDSDFWRNFKRKHPNSRYDLINSLIQQAGFDGIHDKKQGHVVAFKTKQVKQIPFGKTENPHYYSKLKESGLADELEKGARGDWQKEGYTFHHEDWNDDGQTPNFNPLKHDFKIVASKNGKPVGYAYVNHLNQNQITPHDVSVDKTHRRKGIASGMYSYAEKLANKKMANTYEDQSKAAKALWSQPSRPFGKTESLAKAPVEYIPDPQDTHKKIPALNDNYPIINKVNLPNGLIYQQHTKNDYRGPVHVHHLYHPNEKNPVAEVITRPDPDNEMNHQVSYSQVSPEHKGKGLGKQAYLAALVHGKGVGRLVSDNEVSKNAHKLWGHFKNVKGLGGKIGKYVRKDADGQLPESNISDKAYYDQHQVFIKQKSALDHNAMFPPIEGSGQEKLAASEPLEKDQPVLKFPKVKNVPTRTDVELYSIPEGRTKSANRKKEIAARAGTNRARLGYEEVSGKKLPQASYDKDVANKKKLISEIANSRDKKGVSAGVVSTPGMGGKSFKGRSIGYYSETNPRYVQQHEAAHLTLQHIADKHGENARRKVVDHLLAHFHPDDVNAMARKLGGGSYSQSNHLSEEVLNFLHDLPHKDEKTKAHYAAHGVDENRVKAGWKRASQYAREKITPEWLADEGSDVNSIREQSKSLRPTDLTLRNPGKLTASEMAKADSVKKQKTPHPFKVGDRVKKEQLGSTTTGTVTAVKTEGGTKHKMKIKYDNVGEKEFDKVGHGGKWDLWDHTGYWEAHEDDIKKSLNRKTGVSGVSENIGLDRLKQIKQDNYVGVGGKDYSPDELHQRMFEIQDKQAAKQKLFPEQESEKTHGSFEEMAPPPMMPRMKKIEISDAIVKGSARNELKKSEDFKSKLSQPHAIFSVENSPYPDKVKIPQTKGKDHHEETVNFLRSKGEDAHSIQGHYGSPERSIIVFNPKNANAIKNIAHSFGQESWINSNGKQHKLEMLHGPAAGHVFTGEGTELYQNKPQDYYSTLPDGTYFTHKINF